MPASPLIQLVAIGQVDQYLSLTPQLSYFKYVYKRHTRFALDNLKLNFDGKSPELSKNTHRCTIKIPRHGDLLTNTCLVLSMPDIYSNDDLRFRWIENFGTLLIKQADIFVGSLGRSLNPIYGEWMLIWNELTLSPSKLHKYNQITGNTSDYLNPRLANSQIVIKKNNQIEYAYYPSSNKETSNTPSIKSKLISIPLQFYFSKNPSLAIPLCALQTSEVIITIDIESVEKLYQIYDKDYINNDGSLGKYISSSFYNSKYNTDINIKTFTKRTDLNAYIEAQYVYLNEIERKLITVNRRNNIFLIENIYKKDIEIAEITKNIELDLSVPIKELVWTLKRRDYANFNLNTTYTDDNNHIMNTCKILWNKSNERVEEKDHIFFGKIQPYQHHSSIPKDGIYCYSFALYPEKWQPSGYYNPGGKFPINTLIQIGINEEFKNNIDYEVTVYAIQYNIFEIIGGMGGFKFS
jgi:hypothetical protein